jgi:hypothetical protein
MVHDLAGHVQDRGVVAPDEVGVGGQDGSVQLWEWIGDEGATTFSY